LATVGGLEVVDAIHDHAARATWAVGSLLASGIVLRLLEVEHPGHCWQRGGRAGTEASWADTIWPARLLIAYIPLYLLAMYLMAVLSGRRRYARVHGLRLPVIGASAGSLVAFAALGRVTVTRAAVLYLDAHLAALLGHSSMPSRQTGQPLGRWRGRRPPAPHLQREEPRPQLSLDAERGARPVAHLAIPGPASLGPYVIAVTPTSPRTLVGSAARRTGHRHPARFRGCPSPVLLLPRAACFGQPYLGAAPAASILQPATVVAMVQPVLHQRYKRAQAAMPLALTAQNDGAPEHRPLPDPEATLTVPRAHS
jgi:hypothetical protein